MLAVLHRHGGLVLADQDVFINVVGGIRVSETAADLPMLLALNSSFRDRPLPSSLVCFGEVGLSGEIRPVADGQDRLKAAVSHGYQRVIIPHANKPRQGIANLQIIAVRSVAEALSAVAEMEQT
jgi:DNA repair protein RadA/Sms